MSTPRFEVVDEIFVITVGAATPSFACEDEFNARVAMHSLNELLDRAEKAEAENADLRREKTILDEALDDYAEDAGALEAQLAVITEERDILAGALNKAGEELAALREVAR